MHVVRDCLLFSRDAFEEEYLQWSMCRNDTTYNIQLETALGVSNELGDMPLAIFFGKLFPRSHRICHDSLIIRCINSHKDAARLWVRGKLVYTSTLYIISTKANNIRVSMSVSSPEIRASKLQEYPKTSIIP